jgi:putative solute:sodium symporter small subunit
MSDMVRAVIAARARHWARARRLTGLLLLLWFGTTVGTVFFARELAGITVFGWPLSFYLAAQGAALVYLAILGIYALAMGRHDKRFARELAQAQGEAPPAHGEPS